MNVYEIDRTPRGALRMAIGVEGYYHFQHVLMFEMNCWQQRCHHPHQHLSPHVVVYGR